MLTTKSYLKIKHSSHKHVLLFVYYDFHITSCTVVIMSFAEPFLSYGLAVDSAIMWCFCVFFFLSAALNRK